jgi:MraZ protein
MFRGINSITMDAKGRISMPARYRESLQKEGIARMVVTIDTDERCLLLYPLSEWEVIEAKLAQGSWMEMVEYYCHVS